MFRRLFPLGWFPHDVQNVGPVKVNRAFHLQKMGGDSKKTSNDNIFDDQSGFTGS